jgi:hypothetical protein
VRVLQLGRRVLGYAGAAGLTVQEALDALGMSVAAGVDLRVNGRPATGASVLSDGDVVTLIPRIKGGHTSPRLRFRQPALSAVPTLSAAR